MEAFCGRWTRALFTLDITSTSLSKDMNADGVEELINIHGGDQTYNAEETNRSPASLVVVSGATGQSLMDPIQLPDNYESYMSPVLFRMNGSLELVLIGTGGETFPGSLWAISMSSIKTRVVQKLIYMKQSLFMNNTCFLESDTLLRMSQPKFDDTVVDFTRPYLTSKLEAYCPKWSNIVPTWNKYGVCVYKLMNSTTKGIMLPPVIVDLNKDGVKDLVVSTFDGRTIALDGTDLVTQLWDIYYPNTETYSIPAPIFYTDNSVPEILIRTSLGEYPTYNSSTIRLLNGSDGAELWNFSSAHTSMMSPLTITSYSPGLDAMLFITVGSMSDSDSSPTGNMSHSNSNSNSTSDTLSNNIDKGNTADIWISTPEDPFPDPDTDVTSFVEHCGQSIDQLASYVWLFTKEMIERGEELKPLAKHEPFVSILSNTNQSSEENARHDRDLDPSNISPKTKRCGHIVAPIMSFTTPALGDFNQDGRLDVAYSIVWGPLGGMMMVPPKFKVFVFTLEERFKEVYGSDVVVDFNGFLPSNEQPWSRYMGTTGDNVYRSNN